MQVQNKSNKRRTVYIKKEFQFRFIFKFCLILLAGVILSTGLLVFLSRQTLTSTFENSRLVIENTGSAIFPAILMTNLITLGIICIAVIMVTLYVSHKIAGPMFRFEKDLEKIRQGDLCVNINLRKQDQFAEMALALNTMTQSIHDKVSKIDKGLDGLLESSSDDAVCPGCETKIRELKTIISTEFTL